MKIIKKKEMQKAIITMLWKQDPKLRNEILNSIDCFLINELKVEKKLVPWLNQNKDNYNGYMDFLSLLRLTYVRVFSEYYDRHHDRLH